VGLAAVCDILVAAEGVNFCLSEAKLGLLPATIGPYVVKALGEQASRRYFTTAERFDAARAQALGFVHEVVPADALDAKVDELGAALVANVRAQQERIDQLIAQSSEHWRFERLSPVDLNVLRVATAEFLQAPRVPTNVVIDEAIEIARRFGSAESAVFVNGVLDQIATHLGVKGTAGERSTPDDG